MSACLLLNKKWVKQNLANITDTQVYILPKNSAAVDLAVLSSCDHTIMSSGTFSYWAAYLANGIATYYVKHPAPGSKLYKRCKPSTHFLPQWVALEWMTFYSCFFIINDTWVWWKYKSNVIFWAYVKSVIHALPHMQNESFGTAICFMSLSLIVHWI